MNQGEKHLSSEQIDWLTGIQPTEAENPAQPELLEAARHHLSDCKACQKLVSMYGHFDRHLHELKAICHLERKEDCPPERELFELACGLLSTERSDQVLTHLPSCGFCGPFLRQAIVDLDDHIDPGEEDMLAGLHSVEESWQRHLAARLSQTTRKSDGLEDMDPDVRSRSWRWFPVKPRWAVVFAAAAVLAVAALWSLRESSGQAANRLIAQAYAERRTLELRVPGATYAPMQVIRGTENPVTEAPQSLLDVRALIARNLKQHPTDPLWLQAKARADLLEWDYRSAIKELTSALATQPDSSSLKTDLATAYFERAKSLDRAIDYGSSIELLSQALVKTPNDPVVLFNRALTYEQLPMLHEALRDWERYLQLDPNGAWATEARQHADAVRQQLAQHDESLKTPLLDISEFVAAVNPADESSWKPVDARIDEYLDLSIQRWLPTAFPTRTAKVDERERTSARRALSDLALILSHDHHDTWLSEFLDRGPSEATAIAITRLSEALRANLAGNASTGRLDSLRAESLFRQAGNHPGVVRAQFEEIYSLHRLFHGAECSKVAAQLERDLDSRSYSWIRTQLGLERFACFSSQTQMTRGAETISASLHLAELSSYGTLYLRGLGFAAALETDNDNLVAAESWDQEGLRKYWSGAYPPLRAYQFYDDLTDHARQAQQWQLAAALGREATQAISLTPNRSGEAMARFRLAISTNMAGNLVESASQYALAENIFAALPSNDENLGFLADSELQLAEIEAMHGHREVAETQLARAKSHLPAAFNSYDTWLTYYRTKAEVARLREDYRGMQLACGAAVTIGESALSTIATEHDRLTWNHATARCYKTLVEAELHENDFMHALELWEWYQGAALRQRQPVTSHIRFVGLEQGALHFPNLTQVQLHLKDLSHQTVLAYAQLPNEVFAWAYDDRGVRQAQIQVTRSDLERIASEFAAECADPRSDLIRLRNKGRLLFDWLIAPFSADLDPDRTLLIEADGSLASLPFQALVQPDGSYLGLQRTIAFSPGLEYMLRLRPETSVTADTPALVVGEPTISGFGSGFVPLPDANREAHYISHLFVKSTMLTGNDATDQAILQHLPQSAVFHFAGHAIAGPEGTGLEVATRKQSAVGPTPTLLAPNYFSASNLSRMRLAVLSACSTGRPGDDGLADSGSIAMAFLQAGVPNVVASRWTVDSVMTANLMNSFYLQLFEGNSVGRALQKATSQLSHIPGRAHPYFWASFGVFGRA